MAVHSAASTVPDISRIRLSAVCACPTRQRKRSTSSGTTFITPPQSGQPYGEGVPTGEPSGSDGSTPSALRTSASSCCRRRSSTSGGGAVPLSSLVTILTTSSARACRPRARAAGVPASALRGIDGNSACAGSCTSAVPPYRATAARPAVPSSSIPVRTTPTTRGPWARAAERSSTSTDGRYPFSLAPRASTTRPSRTTRWPSGCATYTVPSSSGSSSTAARTGEPGAAAQDVGQQARGPAGQVQRHADRRRQARAAAGAAGP